MGAKMTVRSYDVAPVKWGDVSVERENEGGDPTIKLRQDNDSIWIEPDDVDALIEALNEARRP